MLLAGLIGLGVCVLWSLGWAIWDATLGKWPWQEDNECR